MRERGVGGLPGGLRVRKLLGDGWGQMMDDGQQRPQVRKGE